MESSGSEDTHELSRDISHDETDVLGDPTCWMGAALGGGGDNFSVNSSFGLFALRLIAFYVFQLFDNSGKLKCLGTEKKTRKIYRDLGTRFLLELQ